MRKMKDFSDYILIESYSYDAIDAKGTVVHYQSNDREKVRALFEDYKNKLIKEFVNNFGWVILKNSTTKFECARSSSGEDYLTNRVALSIRKTGGKNYDGNASFKRRREFPYRNTE